jgi:hypothetical protein
LADGARARRRAGKARSRVIERTVSSVKAVKSRGQAVFSFHGFTKYVKVLFFRGAALRPFSQQVQAKGSSATWHPRTTGSTMLTSPLVKQASRLPGGRM